jgi:hypothetical protein
MSKELAKPIAPKARLPAPRTTTIANTGYRVGKALSLRLRAFDKRAEAAEARAAKAEAKRAEAAKVAETT